MRGREFWTIVRWPLLFAAVPTLVEGVLCSFEHHFLLLELAFDLFVVVCVVALLVCAILVLIFLLGRKWRDAFCALAFGIAAGATPFLMVAAAETAQVAHFSFHQAMYLAQVKAIRGEDGNRLVAFDWYACDLGLGYCLLVYDESDAILLPAKADPKWFQRASRTEIGKRCILDKPDAFFELLKIRPLGQHFYLIRCEFD